MKKLALLLILFCSIAQANEVKCYSNGHMVYSRHVRDISYMDDVLVFVEENSDKVVITTLDCVVKIPT
jgi:hypothetical protein